MTPPRARARATRSTSAKITAAVVAVLASHSQSHAGLVGQWIGDTYSGGTWTDSSGLNHTASPVGSLTTTDNFFNGHRAVNFTGGSGAGASGFFTVTNDATALFGATELTLVAVFNPTTGGTSSGAQFWQNSGLIGNEQGGAVNDWGMGLGNSLTVMGVGAPDTTITSSSTLTLGTGHVMIGTWNNTGAMSLWVDGVQVAQTAAAPTAARNSQAFPSFALGADVSVQNGDLKIFNGQVAEFRIYNDASQNIPALTQTLTNTYLVPEPSSLAFLGLGIAGALGVRRRRE